MSDEVFVKSAPLGGRACSRSPRGQAVYVYDAQGVSNAEGGAAVSHCGSQEGAPGAVGGYLQHIDARGVLVVDAGDVRRAGEVTDALGCSFPVEAPLLREVNRRRYFKHKFHLSFFSES